MVGDLNVGQEGYLELGSRLACKKDGIAYRTF